MNTGFWRRRRVLLTGHTGFKGSWLSLWLQHLGAEVTGYALESPTEPSLFDVARVADGMVSIFGDIRDVNSLGKAMSAAAPEIVIHMAAQPLVRLSYTQPVETFATNVMGTVNVLEAVREQSAVRAVIIVTSDKCYENREWVWGYREEEPFGGHDPYSSSKGCAELATAAYRKSFFGVGQGRHPARVATARAGNVIGGGDWAEDRLVPDIVRALSAGAAVLVRNPESIRPWQHVLEPLGGYLLLAERLATGGVAYEGGWNFGPRDDDARPVREIVGRCCSLWGPDASWEHVQASGPHEARYLKLDCSKAAAYLGWRPVWTLDTAIDMIVHWHRAHGSGGDPRATTLSQIVAYQSCLTAERDE